jgi:hypothetical protein
MHDFRLHLILFLELRIYNLLLLWVDKVLLKLRSIPRNILSSIESTLIFNRIVILLSPRLLLLLLYNLLSLLHNIKRCSTLELFISFNILNILFSSNTLSLIAVRIAQIRHGSFKATPGILRFQTVLRAVKQLGVIMRNIIESLIWRILRFVCSCRRLAFDFLFNFLFLKHSIAHRILDICAQRIKAIWRWRLIVFSFFLFFLQLFPA